MICQRWLQSAGRFRRRFAELGSLDGAHTMKSITPRLILIAALVLSGCCSTTTHQPRQRDYSGMPATDIVVTISCSEPSMAFTGTIVSDGHTEQLSGTGSGTFRASGHEFVCSFKKTGREGRISISVSEGDQSLGSSSTPKRFGGVRAELLRTPSAQHTLFTTF